MIIPTFAYFNEKMEPVPSASDPDWYYTVLGGHVRTRKDGPLQQLVDGKWIDIEKKK